MDLVSGSSTANFTSIGAALSGAQPGDQVLIHGAVHPTTGAPLAYSDGSSETTLPLQIPAGVSVSAYPGPPVYVTSTSGAPVFEALNGSAGQITSVSKIALAGGSIGILTDVPAGQYLDLRIKDVDFGPNTVGLDAKSDGGLLFVSVENCRIVNTTNFPSPAPAAQSFTTGLRFRSEQTPGRVDATVGNLTLAGSFPASKMAPAAFLNPGRDHDLAAYASSITRLIQVSTAGTGTGEYPGVAQGDLSPAAISQVNLTLSGCVLDGRAAQGSGDGWDVGVYATTTPGPLGSGDYDFQNGFDVRILGTEIKNLRAAGVYGETYVNSRGNLRLSGQTSIRRTGIQLGSGGTHGSLRSGLHTVNQEGYMGVEADNCTFEYNHGHGVYIYDPYSYRGMRYVPTGSYLGMQECEVHLNGADGVALDGMRAKASMPNLVDQGANVGGTQDHFDPNASAANYLGNTSLVNSMNEPGADVRPHGQGSIDRCSISNNGGAGISLYLAGNTGGLPGTFSTYPYSIASCRIENTILWDNPAGGFVATLLPHDPQVPFGPLMLMPVVHSTLADNGSTPAAPFNMEVVQDASLGFPPGFGYTGDISGIPLQTALFNSIFQRATVTDLDWGSSLEGLVTRDLGPPTTVGHLRIGVTGVRAAWTSTLFGGATPLVSMNARDPNNPNVPFASPFMPGTWNQTDAEQYYLTSGGYQDFYASPNFFTVVAALAHCAWDHAGDQRPTDPLNNPDLMDWDKGADQL